MTTISKWTITAGVSSETCIITACFTVFATSSVTATNKTCVAAFRKKKRVYCEMKCTNASTELDRKLTVDVFERRRSSENEIFSLLQCLNEKTFVFLGVFALRDDSLNKLANPLPKVHFRLTCRRGAYKTISMLLAVSLRGENCIVLHIKGFLGLFNNHLIYYEWGWVWYEQLCRSRRMLSAEVDYTASEISIIRHIPRKPNSVIFLYWYIYTQNILLR